MCPAGHVASANDGVAPATIMAVLATATLAAPTGSRFISLRTSILLGVTATEFPRQCGGALARWNASESAPGRLLHLTRERIICRIGSMKWVLISSGRAGSAAYLLWRCAFYSRWSRLLRKTQQ